MAATVRSSKVAIDDAGKTLVAEMKKRPALVDASRRKIREALDELAIEIRQPVTDWEAEQERLKKEEEERVAAEAYSAMRDEADAMNADYDRAKAEALAKQIESDHEIALLMNDKFDRDRAEAARLAEQQRIDHEQRIAREAEERVKRETEEKAQREREQVEREKLELQAAAEKEKQERIAAEQRAEQQRIEAQQLAERDKREAIEAERRKAAQVEQARLDEEKRIKDEADRRARDTEHRRNINLAAVSALVESGLTEDCAKACIKSIAKGQVPAVTINY
ncbi:cell envelope biogenesis protein TolA [Tatumella sp. JGM130]|nr:cell envelope biogenesis protein TolA [Tatumella sp. JGM130]MBS0895639.1 cell envelope biogenesis protein TolA [Tatumella sp. JGM130]